MGVAKIEYFEGMHCESTATGTLLKQLGIQLSEPMIFGLGQGLDFIYWRHRTLPMPFLGGRVKPDLLTENLCRNFGLKLEVEETRSAAKAWKSLRAHLDAGKLVGLKLDAYHLEYFQPKIHFAGHYVAAYGYDEQRVYLVDVAPQGSLMNTSIESLAAARAEKGPMSSPHRSYRIEWATGLRTVEEVALGVIRENALAFINPPISNIGYRGIKKAGQEIPKWFAASKAPEEEFVSTAAMMERGGTGGALFRNFYRDFLKEVAGLMGHSVVSEAAEAYVEIAGLWTQVAGLLEQAGRERDEAPVMEASRILNELSEKEYAAQLRLAELEA